MPDRPDNPTTANVPEVFRAEREGLGERLAVGLEYLGTAYSGYQVQGNTTATVQYHLERAFASVANHPVRFYCAGRTDAGVHATHQVVHFDTASRRKAYGWMLGANTRLPDDISVQWVKPVGFDFHARFMATARRYRYIIYNHMVPSAPMRGITTWERKPLDVHRMQQAAGSFCGTHDFSSFRAAECQAQSPVRTVHHCRVARQGRLVVIDVRADAFLHHMVRNIAGVLMAIGAGEAPIGWAQDVLSARSRRRGGVTARPEGLFLVDAEYDSRFCLPAPTPGPAFLDKGTLQSLTSGAC